MVSTAALLGGAAAAWPLAARAQQAKRPLVGYLAAPAAVVRSATSLGFFKGLRDQGYVGGQEFDLAQRFADGFLQKLVRDLSP
jgi:putative ABC transport system substrate-binding protein